MMAADSNEPDDDVLDFGLEQFGEIDDEQGLSLEELSQAYAELIDDGADPYARNSEEEKPVDQPWEMDSFDADEACDISPSSILEAMLFVGHPENVPLTSREVAALMRGVRPTEIDTMVQELNQAYREDRCPFEIRSVGAGYRMELRPEFSALRDRFYGRIKAAKLSQNVVDVLAIVSYKQPISKNELEAIRGKPSSGILSQLVRRQLLQLVRENEPDEELGDEGDSKAKKRRRKKTAAHYYTTSRFLQVFGLSSLDDLPRSDEIDRLS